MAKTARRGRPTKPARQRNDVQISIRTGPGFAAMLSAVADLYGTTQTAVIKDHIFATAKRCAQTAVDRGHITREAFEAIAAKHKGGGWDGTYAWLGEVLVEVFAAHPAFIFELRQEALAQNAAANPWLDDEFVRKECERLGITPPPPEAKSNAVVLKDGQIITPQTAGEAAGKSEPETAEQVIVRRVPQSELGPGKVEAVEPPKVNT